MTLAAVDHRRILVITIGEGFLADHAILNFSIFLVSRSEPIREYRPPRGTPLENDSGIGPGRLTSNHEMK
jgi:hypothetical protein